jgi:hypothetical protein
LLSFAYVYFFESGLFNGLWPIQVKNFGFTYQVVDEPAGCRPFQSSLPFSYSSRQHARSPLPSVTDDTNFLILCPCFVLQKSIRFMPPAEGRDQAASLQAGRLIQPRASLGRRLPALMACSVAQAALIARGRSIARTWPGSAGDGVLALPLPARGKPRHRPTQIAALDSPS